METVRTFYAEWDKAKAERGAEGFASFVAEDALLLPPDAPPLSGRAAIRAWQERAPKGSGEATSPTSASEDELTVSGGYVIHRSTVKGQRAAKSGGGLQPFETRYMDVLRRKPDGSYELVRRMWNTN